MRWLWLTILVLFAVAMLLFLLQNRDFVTLSFLRVNIRAPFALVVGVAYVVGAVTGGTLLAFLRRSYKGSRRGTATSV